MFEVYCVKNFLDSKFLILPSGFAQNVLQAGPNPRRGKKSDEAHPPIHPTKYADNLQGMLTKK